MQFRASIAKISPRSLCYSAIAAATLAAIAVPAQALDARAMGVGGSAIARGAGVHGVLDNPSALMQQQRAGESVHLHTGMAVDLRDGGGIIDTLTDSDNERLASDIGDEVDRITGAEVQCVPGVDPADTVCLEGTGRLGELAGDILNILDEVDGERIEAQASGGLGVGITGTPVPFAVHLRVAATGAGRPTVADGDRSYVGDFQNLLADDQVTLGDIEQSPSLNVEPVDLTNPVTPTLDVVQPEDALSSQARASAMARVQLGISLAHSITVGAHQVDLGITPKLSTLRAASLDTSIADQFDDNSDSLLTQFEDSENSKSSLTIDVGASMALPDHPVRVAGVLRNLIPESIKTDAGFEFKTTPQLILGGVYQLDRLSFSADLALNRAKVDNFDTQVLALGVEYGTDLLQVRGGIAHDAGRDADATALSVGFGVGPLQVGARLASLDAAQASVQLDFRF